MKNWAGARVYPQMSKNPIAKNHPIFARQTSLHVCAFENSQLFKAFFIGLRVRDYRLFHCPDMVCEFGPLMANN